MRYAVLIYSAEESWAELTPAEQDATLGEYIALNSDPSVIAGEQLQAGETATTVRVADGHTLTTDGPYPESKEVLGGFYLLEAADLDQALAFAARIPAARTGGAIEVRPLVERQG